MEIQKERVKRAFAEYVSQYDLNDGKIKLKADHTYRVAAISRQIAENLQLSKEDVDLAWLIGMLHDIGRFEQVRRFGTFSDTQSIDHAHFGIEVLFQQGKIRDYMELDVLPEIHFDQKLEINWRQERCAYREAIELLIRAVWNHSAYRIEEGMDSRTILFCHIIRDADKIDILKVAYDIPMEVIYNVSADEIRAAQVTDEVMQQFREKHAILRSVKRTPIDNIVGYMALVFELEFPVSLQLVKEQGYLERLLQFDSGNPVTKAQFQELRQCMETYLGNTTCLSERANL